MEYVHELCGIFVEIKTHCDDDIPETFLTMALFFNY